MQQTVRAGLHIALILLFSACLFHLAYSAEMLGRTIQGPLDLRGRTINVPFDFRGVTFDGMLDMRGATFKKRVRFDNATFKGRVRFDNATFADHADFGNATFRDRADFKKATFEQRADFDKATFRQLAVYYNTTFRDRADFKKATFGEEAAFYKASFRDHAFFDDAVFQQLASFDDASFDAAVRFHRTIFRGTVNLQGTNFKVVAGFHSTTFTKDHDFRLTRFTGKAEFNWASFKDDVHFDDNTFHNTADFRHATFHQNAGFHGVTFTRPAEFRGAVVGGSTSFRSAVFESTADFRRSRFSRRAVFRDAHFGRTTDFSEATFFAGASFANTVFTEDVAFEKTTFTGRLSLSNMRVLGDLSLRSGFFTKPVTITNANWQGHVSWRDATFTDLRWESDPLPSTVAGRFDARGVQFRNARIRNVHFHELAYFSDARFGHAPKYSIHEIEPALPSSRTPARATHRQYGRLREPGVLFDRNIFEKDADFLRATFVTDAVFVENHFPKTWNLTDVTFPGPADADPPPSDPFQQDARLCLSYNQFTRFVLPRHQLAPDHLWTRNFAPGLYSPASLETSRIRAVKETTGDGTMYSCAGLFEVPRREFETLRRHFNAPRRQQDLSAVYETLEASFRRNNDRSGENEAWYLRKVAERETNYQQADRTDWMVVTWRWVSLILWDSPSRYGIDLVRVVIVSCFIVLTFFMIYTGYIQYLVSVEQWRPYINRSPYPEQRKVVRFRPFEPLFGDHETRRTRPLHPLKDGLLLSCRLFFQMGMGTSYPETRWLKCMARLEWGLGLFMLIHFIVAVKNTLPIALFFFAGQN